MHPFIIQSMAAERTRDLRETIQHNHDASLARARLRRQRRAAKTSGTVSLLPAWLGLHMS